MIKTLLLALALFPGRMNVEAVRQVCDTVASWQLSHFDHKPEAQNPYIAKNQLHWSAGVLYIGMYRWADWTQDERIFSFLKGIGDTNAWALHGGRTIYHADDICVGQTFLEMSERYGCPGMAAATLERAHTIASSPSSAPLSKRDKIGQYDRWAWCDALFMAPAVYAAAYRMTSDSIYLKYMESEFRECTDSLFDRNEGLYCRDCIRRQMREPNGKGEFWARGNAWVFAGIALTLDNLPANYEGRGYFEDIFRTMAASIVRCQRKDGSWTPSMLDPGHYPFAENSSSSLFCYGLAWGINRGILPEKAYRPALEKGWKSLCSYVQKDGKLGFVQPIGAFPQGGITADDTQVYAVGGFLLAGREISLMLEKPLLGRLRTKTLSQTHNDLTLGCECLDRDYADYHKYKEYLEPLGIRKIRLQAGWARTEKVKGVYDFVWLDSIIDDAVSRGLEPWLQTSYGNPIYEGGGTPYLAGGWPVSQEARDAWDAWVRAMALRYKGKVHEWEIWNEPDINKTQFADPASFVELTVRTARIIKEVDPSAKLAAFALAYCRPEVYDRCLSLLKDWGALDLFDWTSYHLYRYRPEDINAAADTLKAVLDKYGTRMVLRQGETGAPSVGYMGGALSNWPWSEVSQAKWDIRRMLSDKGRGIPTTVFTISDFHYSAQDHIKTVNRKGLLGSDSDNNIIKIKESYRAVQNLATLWDEADEPLADARIVVQSPAHHSVYAFRDSETSLESFVIWRDAAAPGDGGKFIFERVSFEGLNIRNPVAVDIRTGLVYKVSGNRVPVYDSPVMIIDRNLIKFK